jgi:hypothetical protein
LDSKANDSNFSKKDSNKIQEEKSHTGKNPI